MNVTTGESTLLIGNSRQSNLERLRLRFRYRHQRCCLKSKAVILILVWNLIITIGIESFLDPSYYLSYLFDEYASSSFTTILIASITVYSSLAFLFLFYPLAGCLADIRWGRYKAVVNSLCVIWWSLVAIVIIVAVSLIPILEFAVTDYTSTAMLGILYVIIGISLIALLLLLCGLVCFSANVIQFGVDQLHDAPMEDSILYIHWFVWTCYAGLLPLKLLSTIELYSGLGFCLVSLPLLLLGVTLLVQRYKRHWFLIDSGSRNPYKLVYKVLKFAKDHTNPLRRSAFTYCEDELPSRLDFGKEKYGGPFSTEQVEDVKAFLGILQILLTLGPIMMVDFSMGGIFSKLTCHFDKRESSTFRKATYFNIDSLTSLSITLLIPFYLCLLRRFIRDYIPGMLKRIALGMIVILLSVLCTSVMDAYGHIHSNVTTCFLNDDLPVFDFCDVFTGYCTNTLDINQYFLTIQYFLNAVGYMLLYIAVYEFICAQSPHAMKGLVIGTFFAIKGVFQLLGVLIIYMPFESWWPQNIMHSFPSCGFVYYFINAIVVLIGIVAYTIVARRYQYRERDEPDNIYRYAEEYYANTRDEPNYDYDDYDNLNVHTVDGSNTSTL